MLIKAADLPPTCMLVNAVNPIFILQTIMGEIFVGTIFYISDQKADASRGLGR